MSDQNIGCSIAAHEATDNRLSLLIPSQVWVHARLQHSSEPTDHDVPNTVHSPYIVFFHLHHLSPTNVPSKFHRLNPSSSITYIIIDHNETVTATFSDRRVLQAKIQQQFHVCRKSHHESTKVQCSTRGFDSITPVVVTCT